MPRWIIVIIVLVVVGAGAYFALGQGAGEEEAEPTPIADTLPPVSASDRVVAEAEVVPVRDVELRFEIGGTIAEVLVSEGDRVDRGAVLAQLDTRDLQLAVEEAAAKLAQSRADLEQLLDGATPDEITAAQAQIANAEAQLANAEANLQREQAGVSSAETQVSRAQAEVARNVGQLQQTRGAVTQEDITAAQARLEEARATLADLEDGADAVDVETAQAAYDQAVINLEETRDQLSFAKTTAESRVEVAANELRNRQAEYSEIYWQIREIERELNTVDQEIWQEQKNREEQAQRRVRNAEEELEQAQLNLEEAQQAEITGIQAAETQVREARAQLDDVLAGAEADELAAARAAVADAQAELARLQGEERAGNLAAAAAGVSSAEADVANAQANVSSAVADVEAAQANIEAAQAELERRQANLEDLTAEPRKPEIDDREAVILAAEVTLKQTERELEKASLLAPMSGTVVEVNLEEGERIDTSDVAVRMADFSEWEVETTDLTELGVVRIEVGDPVIITFDALPELELEGTVKSIQDIGKNEQGDIVYKVTVTPDEWDSRLRWGMTATVSIEPSDE